LRIHLEKLRQFLKPSIYFREEILSPLIFFLGFQVFADSLTFFLLKRSCSIWSSLMTPSADSPMPVSFSEALLTHSHLSFSRKFVAGSSVLSHEEHYAQAFLIKHCFEILSLFACLSQRTIEFRSFVLTVLIPRHP
jgi:hypothetical protein